MSPIQPRSQRPSVLLLPYPPEPSTPQSLNAAYGAPIKAALAKLKDPERQLRLVIAVALPLLHGQFARFKTLSWAKAQSVTAGIYTIVAIACSELSIPTEIDGGPGSLDVTVLLVDHERTRRFPPDFRPAVESNSTIVVDVPTFAITYHPWNCIFHVRCELGLQVYQTYLRFAEGRQPLRQDQLIPVDGGITLNLSQAHLSETPTQTDGYRVVCLGGTFDHLHPGHRLLLSAGALLLKVPEKGSTSSCQFIIGITGDEMLKNKKYAEYVQPWDARARGVIRFLSVLLDISVSGWKEDPGQLILEGPDDLHVSFRDGTILIKCVKIQDAFGPTVTMEHIDALVVSGETRGGGSAVNERRTAQGWQALEIFEVDVLNAQETQETAIEAEKFASKISSSAIRAERAQKPKP